MKKGLRTVHKVLAHSDDETFGFYVLRRMRELHRDKSEEQQITAYAASLPVDERELRLVIDKEYRKKQGRECSHEVIQLIALDMEKSELFGIREVSHKIIYEISLLSRRPGFKVEKPKKDDQR